MNENIANKENDIGIDYLREDNFTEAFKHFEIASNLGHREAKYHLANLYYYGEGVECDYSKAASLFEEVAICDGSEEDLDIVYARFNLANAYYKGEGVNQDVDKAFYFYTKAAELKHPIACFNVGRSYFTGEIVGQDFNKAYEYLIVAANEGMDLAQYMIGVLHIAGRGCDKDIEQARYWLNLAAEQGEPNAIEVLKTLPEVEENEAKLKEEKEAKMQEYKRHFKDVVEYCDPMEMTDMDMVNIYNIGEVMDKKDYDVSLDDIDMDDLSIDELYNYATSGNRKAEYLYAMTIIDSNGEEAIRYLSLSAAKGYSEAQFTLGLCYVNGLGIEKDISLGNINIAKAAKANNIKALYYMANYYEEDKEFEKMINIYHILADEFDDPEASANLGTSYMFGSTITQDYNKAYFYLNKAYNGGVRDMIATSLGLLYYMGNGINKDYSKALELFKEAANDDEPNAMCYLASMYENGIEVEKDLNKAIEYYKKASELGFEFATDKLKELQ